jgi:hypothetical protein
MPLGAIQGCISEVIEEPNTKPPEPSDPSDGDGDVDLDPDPNPNPESGTMSKPDDPLPNPTQMQRQTARNRLGTDCLRHWKDSLTMA